MEPVEDTTRYLIRNTSTGYYGAYGRDGYELLTTNPWHSNYEYTGISGSDLEITAFRDYLHRNYGEGKLENIEFIWEMWKMS